MNFELSNKVLIPGIGYGTWKIPNLDAPELVAKAIEIGYRHIDTAAIYRNEQGVGEGLKKSRIAREEIFLTTKCWNSDHGFDQAIAAFNQSLELLQTDYIDLYLIHWPKKTNLETWKALEKLYNDKKVKAIGVSNFHQHHLQEIIDSGSIIPMINQIELHPRLNQKNLVKFGRDHNVITEAWSPLMRGDLSSLAEIEAIAQKHNKTVAQVIIRWNLDKGIVVLPKTATVSRMKENFDVFDFSLSENEINMIDSLNRDERIGPDPDNYDF